MTPSTPADLPEHDNALQPGARLGEFEIQGVIGVGGFGIVYRALDHDLERDVAIKEYMPGQFAGRDATGAVTVRARSHVETFGIGLRSFINEARLLARFDHPALLKVYRYWEANGTAYMAMPFYDGSTLAQVVQGLPMPPTQDWLMGVIEPLLGALELLHSQQIYHRDISPDNILLLHDGKPVLLDFGAARRVIGDRTQTLTAILKPNYAPIEQYAEIPGLKQGPWTDLYALGAVVYASLTGKPPSPAATRAVMDDLVPLAQIGQLLEQRHAQQYSDHFLAAWQATLAVRPVERLQSIAQLRAALRGEHVAVMASTAPVAVTTPPAPTAPHLANQADPDEVDSERTVIRLPAGRPSVPPPLASAAAADEDSERTVIRPSHRGATTGPASVAPPHAPPPPTIRPEPVPPAIKLPPPPPPPHAAQPRRGAGMWLGLGALALVGVGAGGYLATRKSAEPVAVVVAAPAPVASEVASAVLPPVEPASAAAVPASEPAASAPMPQPAVPPIASAPAPSTTRAPATSASPRQGATSVAGASGPSGKPNKLKTPPVAPSGPTSSIVVEPPPPPPPPAPTGPATATEACGSKYLFALWTCMTEQCKSPKFASQKDCDVYTKTRTEQP
ncbi:MAG: protein kinase [Leptothrix sp. (in: b-proteobacteria)]